MIKLDGEDIARVGYQSLFESSETLGLLIWAETRGNILWFNSRYNVSIDHVSGAAKYFPQLRIFVSALSLQLHSPRALTLKVVRNGTAYTSGPCHWSCRHC